MLNCVCVFVMYHMLHVLVVSLLCCSQQVRSTSSTWSTEGPTTEGSTLLTISVNSQVSPLHPSPWTDVSGSNEIQ